MITIPSPSVVVNDARYTVTFHMDYDILAGPGHSMAMLVRRIKHIASLGGPRGIESLVLTGHGSPGCMQLGTGLSIASMTPFKELRGMVNKIWLLSCEIARYGDVSASGAPIPPLSSGGSHNGHAFMRMLAFTAGCDVVGSTEVQTSGPRSRVYPTGRIDTFEGLVVTYNSQGNLVRQRRFPSVTNLDRQAHLANNPSGE